MSSAEAGHNSAAEEAASRASVMAFVLMYVMRWLRLVQGEDSNTAPRSKVQILLLTSASDAVDGSSTGTRVPSTWSLLRLPRFGGAKRASGHNNPVRRARRRKSCRLCA